MTRRARVVIEGCPHHITQRGNDRQDVFFSDGDRRFYLELLAEQCEKFSMAVEAYCLMTNHFHLIATPKRKDSLAKAVGRTNLYYTRHINATRGRCGHLWQDRFFSCPLDGTLNGNRPALSPGNVPLHLRCEFAFSIYSGTA